MICGAVFGRAGPGNVLIVWFACQVCSHCITNVDGLIPVSGWLAISVISRPNVNAPIRVPAPVHGSQVRLGSPVGPTTFGSLISSDLPGAGDSGAKMTDGSNRTTAPLEKLAKSNATAAALPDTVRPLNVGTLWILNWLISADSLRLRTASAFGSTFANPEKMWSPALR